MTPRSPTLEGFRAIFQRPSLGFAEIAWRWSFGAAAALLITLSGLEYLDTLPVTRGDLLLLRSRQPWLMSQAIGNILRGSGGRLVEAFVVLAVALVAGWIVVAALARAATINALLGHFREKDDTEKRPAGLRSLPLFGVTFLRATVSLAAIAGCFAGFTLGGMASTPDEAGMAVQIAMIIFTLVWLAWSMVNWFLSLAAIFVIANDRDTFGAIADAVDLCRHSSGPLFAVGTSFGLAHVATFIVASMAAAFPLGLATILPGRVVLAALIVVTLLYFAVADFLYMGRLAAYVAILELPEAPPVPSSQPSAFSPQPCGSVDPYELILSDVPAPG
ncbi:MAG: hypothetical protein ACLP6G_17845 [Terriglobales bacterium]